nr:protein EVI2B [Nothobranchius furzeri]
MTTMTSLVFTWLLLLTACSAVTPGLHNNLTNVTSGEEVENMFVIKQVATNRTSVSKQLSEIPGVTVTPPTTEDVHPIENKTRSTPSLQTNTSTTISVSGEKTAASVNSEWMDFTSSTERSTFKVTKSISAVQTRFSQARDQTALSTEPPQSHTTKTQSASQFTRSTSQSTSTTPSTTLISTATTSINTEKSTSIRIRPVTGGDAATSPGSHKTTAAGLLVHNNKAKKKQGKATNQTNHGKVVAGVIGAAIFLMMLGFLLIYIKKQSVQKQQTTTTDWAGPSPFLEGGLDNDKVTLRSSNQISLSSFLPKRLSKRLSLLPETDQELQDMTPGTTFGGKHQGGTSGESVAEQKKNGVDGSVLVTDSKGEVAEAAVNSASMRDH